MMMLARRLRPALCAAAAFVLLACAATAKDHHSLQRTRAYLGAAGAPVTHFNYDGEFFSWKALDTQHLVLYTSPRKAWLLGFDHGCPYLDTATGIQVRSDLQQLWARLDHIVLLPNGWPCTIDRIQPIDLDRFKATEVPQRTVEVRARGT